jgi:hypothetical protein
MMLFARRFEHAMTVKFSARMTPIRASIVGWDYRAGSQLAIPSAARRRKKAPACCLGLKGVVLPRFNDSRASMHPVCDTPVAQGYGGPWSIAAAL